MKNCLKYGKITAFSLGMLAGLILPQCWIAVAAAVMLAVVSFTAKRCCSW